MEAGEDGSGGGLTVSKEKRKLSESPDDSDNQDSEDMVHLGGKCACVCGQLAVVM